MTLPDTFNEQPQASGVGQGKGERRRLTRLILGALLLAGFGQVEAAVELKGWLEWVHEVQLRVLENGLVQEVAVSAGQHVGKGALLLRMDQREAQARVLEAHARVARSLVEVEDAERALTRAKELFDRGLIASEELKDAELAQTAANAEAQAAAATEAAAAVALEHTELRAPFDGIVVARNAWNGAVIYKTLQQEPLILFAPDDRMLARALVPINVLRSFQPGQAVKVRVNGALREARIYSLGVQAVRVEREGAVYYLDAIFERRPNEFLRPSETAQIIAP